MSRLIYKTATWPSIIEFYRSGIDEHSWRYEPMLDLVERIAASPYASGLYANTSMATLQIVQTPEYDPDGEILRISYDEARCEFTFELQETSSTLYKRWTRKCPAEKGFQTLERFLQLKKWFVTTRKPAR